MAHFVGLDVSVEETSVCVVDDVGKVLCERKVRSEPERGQAVDMDDVVDFRLSGNRHRQAAPRSYQPKSLWRRSINSTNKPRKRRISATGTTAPHVRAPVRFQTRSA